MLNYNHLYYFHLIAAEGSVAAAAQRLGVRQPTVSEQLKALEKTLGVALFERTTAGLKLTDAGRLAFEHTSVMFRAGERLVESLGRDDRDASATLRVGLSGAVARSTSSQLLMPLLALDGFVPTIRTGDTTDLLRQLRGRELDFVLCESEPPASLMHGLLTSLVDKTQLVAVAPPSLSPAPDWHDVALVQFRPTSSYRWDVEAFVEKRSLRPRIAAESDDCLFLVEAAAQGGHVAVVPYSVARDPILAGRLRVLSLVESAHAGIHAVYLDSSTADIVRRAVHVLIDHVKDLTREIGL